MTDHFIPNVIKHIKARSKKDCVPNAPRFSMDPVFIPEELKVALNQYGEDNNKVLSFAQKYHKILHGLSNFEDWTPEIYWYLCQLLLYIEYYQGDKDMKQYSMENQKIRKSIYRAGSFIIPVPNLSESRPSVKEKDFIDLLEVNGTNHYVGIVDWVGKDYVTVKVSDEFAKKFTADQKFNIRFRYNTRSIECQNFTLTRVYQNNMSSMFFPKKHLKCNIKDIPIKWINKSIETNPEQMQAVKNILTKTSHPTPYIVFGPPGTGKTSTLVETICQIIIRNPSSRILICTPSNSAADEIVERIKNSSQFPLIENSILRMYSASRQSTAIKPQLKLISNFSDTEVISLPKEVFITKKIVVTTLMTCTRLHAYELRSNYFSYLFIDEAGQATELDTLIPFILMSSMDTNHQSRISGQVIIAGDPKQLGPFCQSKLAELLLSRSMLERLMECEPYLRDVKNQKYDPWYVTKLIQNYRCHSSILHIPNLLFYDGELIAKGGKHTTKALNWSQLPKKGFPIIFHAVRGKESRMQNSPSVCNNAEVNIVIDYIKKLRNSKPNEISVNLNDIGIVTPYRLQKNKINTALKNQKLEGISVGTVEAFQGQEKDVIIISTVRTCVYMKNNEYFVGFLSHPKRFNVALTRAKSLLIVIGHPDVLQQDENWQTFIEYCHRNKACKGEKFNLNPSVDNLNIIECKNTFANSKYDHVVINQDQYRIIEDKNSCPKRQDDQFNKRRRRLLIGPLPQEIYEFEKRLETFLQGWQNSKMLQKKYLNWTDDSSSRDESENDCSTDEDEHDDKSYNLNSTVKTNTLFDDCLKILLIDEKKFKQNLIRNFELKLDE